MKIVLKSIFLLFISFSCFSQNSGKENLNLVFYDDCSNKIIKPEFEVFSMTELNYDYITVYKEIDDWVVQYSTSIKTENDTIRIPKILFAGGNELHSKRWTYLNCEKVCDGIETDFYSNGNKRLEGKFINGKPIYQTEYNVNGIKETEDFYRVGFLDRTRINYFDDTGELDEYEIIKTKKRKQISKTFDRNGKLINREKQKLYILRNK